MKWFYGNKALSEMAKDSRQEIVGPPHPRERTLRLILAGKKGLALGRVGHCLPSGIWK